ncbi:MAG: PadR family transcriptional regulator [Methanobrevibacter sp.]|uniref:PadR family transcriptional regulator n=1 Tax=Methanobrevibacter sp. TaxID=66852 RepID=UPI0025F68877|nr:PadR family transcriptional regulator [Methanobrevibacter sp.]MBR3113565.1 PadR family transcriptional regulator [Methanobrevibacter sp.]
MSNENDKSDIQKDYSKIINNNSIIKHYVNGMSRFLILWIINYNESIHGYGIMKELDKFFSILAEEGSLKKSNPSNIYPILNKMEEDGFISSCFKVKNNKKLKYFKITDDGKYVLDYLYSRFDLIHANPQWNLLFEDMN